MRVPRRLLPLLACALIAGTPAVAHAQGGAGDDQYQDPFAGSDSGGSNGTQSGSGSDSNSGTQGSDNSAPELTQDPDLGSSSSSSSTGTSAAATPATSAPTTASSASRSELPRTGFEAPVVALLGFGLVAAGLGLRLRLAHGRRA